jgi:hypothetical protein
MSFSKLSYDSCAYNKSLEESTNVGKYFLDTPKNNCDKNCFYPSPNLRLAKTGVAECSHKPLIDVSSELLGLNYNATKCPSEKYFPHEYCKHNDLVDCKNDFLQSEDTKISNPPCTLKGTGWNRWEWLCFNPQKFALEPFERDVQNRIITKDNHRPCVPDPIDQKNVFPNNDSDICYTDIDMKQFYNEKETIPFIHWRCCNEIAQY